MAKTSNDFEVTGRLFKVFETEQKSERFKVREFVLEFAESNYPQLIKFQAKNERCDMLEQYAEGEEIQVSFNLSGREWQGKYFTTLEAWKIKRTGAMAALETIAKDEEAKAEPTDDFPNFVAKDSDFPTPPSDSFSSTGQTDLPF